MNILKNIVMAVGTIVTTGIGLVLTGYAIVMLESPFEESNYNGYSEESDFFA